MASIDPSQQSLSAILNKLGINSAEKSNVPKSKDQLGQEDFLKLMTTQLQNQDPFAPMENGEFIAQMAQFSTVTGITQMGETMKNVSNQLSELRIASATQMMGHSVLVPGKFARPNSEGTISGVVDLPKTASNLKIVFESLDGEVLHQENLGPQVAGLIGFDWKDLPEDMVKSKERVLIRAFTGNDGDGNELSTQVFAKVAGTSKTNDSLMLEVEDYGSIDASKVVRFKN